jgi:hypothetical protein
MSSQPIGVQGTPQWPVIGYGIYSNCASKKAIIASRNRSSVKERKFQPLGMHLSKLKTNSTAWNAPEQIKDKFQGVECT